MDTQISLAASARNAARSPVRFAALAGVLALLLGGCTDQRIAQLEERVAAVETKADAAEKRSKAAESIASRAADSPQIVEAPPPSVDNPDAEDEDSPALADQNNGVLPGA
jgi:hypothetical protein